MSDEFIDICINKWFKNPLFGYKYQMQIQELGDAVSTRRKLLGLRQAAVAHISAAVSAVGPQVREAMATHPGFVDIGKR